MILAQTVRRLGASRTPVLLGLVGAALLAAGAGGAFALGRTPSAKGVVTVRVTMLDFRFVLSRHKVPVGRVRFVVVNRGGEPHDFAVGRSRTRVLGPGQRETITATFSKAARAEFRCTLPGHAALGMKGTLVVGRAAKPPTQPPPPPPPTITTTTSGPPSLALTEIGSFDRPDFVTAPPGDEHRLFVVEQKGVIRVVEDGVIGETPFLDISDQVQLVSETGLLGLAFAPDYAESGLFYVYFNRREGNGNVYLEEFRRSTVDPDQADPYSGRVVFVIEKPWENHSGGMLQFGPDGYLYVAVGDGDSGVFNPPGAFAQTLDDLLGNILRIDPRSSGDEPYTVPESNPFVGLAGARPEVWAYGLRNPWRFWIDERSGNLYLGDVGEGVREEVDYLPAGVGGLNLGWPCLEGTRPFDPLATCTGSVDPILEYGHDSTRCSVIGGVVSHDGRLPGIDGAFLYSDLCDGELRALRVEGGRLAGNDDLAVSLGVPVSFGKDGLGRAYVVSLNGPVYRIDPS